MARARKSAGPQTILKSIPRGWTPRDGQRRTFEIIEENFDKADVFVIRAPTGAGKSLLAVTIAAWVAKRLKGKSRILVPNNVLFKQFLDDFPSLTVLSGRDTYECTLYAGQTTKFDCGTHTQLTGKGGKRGPYCKGCPYVSALRRSRVMPYTLCNYWTYLAYRLYGEALVIDEAHNLTQMLRGMAARKLWKHEYNFPHWVRTYGQLHRWCQEALARAPGDKKLQLLRRELEENKVRYLVERGTDLYRGEERECIKLIPVDIRSQPPLLWPSGQVKKIFLLSATLNRKDVEDMGLGDRRILTIDTPSPIPVERRPVYLDLKFNLGAANADRDIPHLARYIEQLLAGEPTKGFIHAPYALANKLHDHLGSHPRLLWHDNGNKRAIFDEFLASDDKVMVGSGMYEGINLAGDLARWQLVTKVPWPSLGEPAYKWLADEDPEGYANEAARQVIQAAGRVSRSETDYGRTIIVDRSFRRLYEGFPDLFPDWFCDAVLDAPALIEGG